MGSVEVAILKAAQEGGYLEKIPETDEEISDKAFFYVEEARKAIETTEFKKDKTVKAIVQLGKQLTSQNKDEEGKDIFGAPLDEKFRGLPVPGDVRHEPTPFPSDFTELGFKEISRLSAEYNAYASRARWMLAVSQNKLAGITHERDAKYRAAYREEYDSHGEKKPTRDILDFAARKNIEVAKLDDTIKTFAEDVTSYKALFEIYGGYVDRLSREWTMRQDEDKRGY